MTLRIPLPTEPAKTPFPILIYGGNTGYLICKTSSPQRAPKTSNSSSPDAVFDYHDPECAEKIRKYTNNSLHHVVDTICTESNFKICADALPEEPKEKLNVVSTLPLDGWPPKDAKSQAILAYTTMGEAFSKFGIDFPRMEEHFRFGEMFWKLNAKLLAEGYIKTHPVALRAGGIQVVLAGITEISTGTVNGTKLVYKVAETRELDDAAIFGEGPALKAPEMKSW